MTFDRPNAVWVAGQLGNGDFCHLEAVAQNAKRRTRTAAAKRVDLRRVLTRQIGNLQTSLVINKKIAADRRQHTFDLINGHKLSISSTATRFLSG